MCFAYIVAYLYYPTHSNFFDFNKFHNYDIDINSMILFSTNFF